MVRPWEDLPFYSMAFPTKSLLLLLLLLLLQVLTIPFHGDAREADDPHLIDSIVRDCAFRSLTKHHHKTTVLYNVSLPPSLSDVTVDAMRYRAGSLWWHGVKIKEFKLEPGIKILPHAKRLIIVRQNLGNLSSVYNNFGNLSGLQLVSPVLGLLIYDVPSLHNSSKNQSERNILIMKKPMMVDFSGIVRRSQGHSPLCASFELDGTVSLSNQTSSNVCVAWRQGHFAFVIPDNEQDTKNCNESTGSGWKVILASTIAGFFGLVLLGLIIVAVANVKKKRSLMVEMERRAYENEALRISMIGHVRAPTAAVARTAPNLEDEYSPSL